ncbi:Uncharacterized protein PECH_002888 [Penicillium ucsense]|uniref:Uncharacterized protein n=1 Tax=Penicillium ucsense TaxID=2839758 RepID=A0A8J8W7A6_9EURO|nr:Uncharacterized protein PECM_002670 [Penicillium ucsense]KAF7730211.1 Uncharacterized protein PECH_002888 [Penicillium ucsense]
MFDLPNAKRVRRDEVQSPASSRAPSPVDENDRQDAHARLGKLLDLDGLMDLSSMIDANKDNTAKATDSPNEEDEQEFEFRLFSAPAKSTNNTASQNATTSTGGASTQANGTVSEQSEPVKAVTQKLRIRLRSPSPSGNPSEGRFIKAFRGWQYYASTPTLLGLEESEKVKQSIAAQRQRYEEIAVTGDIVTAWAKTQPWPGCDLPWRVIHLKRHQTKMPPASEDVQVYVIDGAPVTKAPTTRKKPGKKRRVQLRKKVAAAVAAKEHEAEKKTRKNRERKLKRRQKAREQKAAAASVGGATDGADATMVDADGDATDSDAQ